MEIEQREAGKGARGYTARDTPPSCPPGSVSRQGGQAPHTSGCLGKGFKKEVGRITTTTTKNKKPAAP